MARRKTNTKSKDVLAIENEKFTSDVVEDILEENALAYAPTFIFRAIPSVYDGQKEVHRRILFAGNKSGLTHKKPYKKMLNFVGNVSLLHPHGDSSIYDTIIRMSQWWRYNVPFVDGEGNIGSMSANNDWAASRYVEGRLAESAMLMTDGLNENAVPTILAEDNESQEPEVLPARFPVLFTNGAEGIAFGYTSKVIPHNPVELMKAARLLNKKPTATLSEIMKKVKGPDLPTGGMIINNSEIKRLYKDGVGSISIRGNIEYNKQYNEIWITSIPYGSYRTSMITSITNAIQKYNADSWFAAPPDDDSENDKNIKFTLQLKKGVDPDKAIAWLYQKTGLEYKFNAINNVVVDGSVKAIGLKEYLEIFLKFRGDTLTRIIKFRKGKCERRKEIVEGLLKLLDVTDEVIKKVRAANGKAAAIKAIEKMGFTPLQAQTIGNMPLHSLNKQNSIELKKEDTDLKKTIEYYELLLSNEDEFKKYLDQDLAQTEKDLAPFKDRKTQIIDEEEVKDVKIEAADLVDDTEVVLVAKPNGMQSMTQTVFSNNKDKSPDEIVYSNTLKASDGIFIFTKKGMVMQRLVSDIANSSVREEAQDMHLDVSDFSFDDVITGVAPFDAKAEDKDIYSVSVTNTGRIKVCDLSKALMTFGQKGYITRIRPFHKLKGGLDNEIIYRKIVNKKELESMKIEVKKYSNGSSRASSVKKINVKDLTIQGYSGSGIGLFPSFKENDSVAVVE